MIGAANAKAYSIQASTDAPMAGESVALSGESRQTSKLDGMAHMNGEAFTEDSSLLMPEVSLFLSAELPTFSSGKPSKVNVANRSYSPC